MSDYQLGLYEKAMPSNISWSQKLVAARQAGFDFLEISIDETDDKLSRLDWSKSERFDLIRLSHELGMPIQTMCLSGHRKYPLGSLDSATRQHSLEIMKKAIILANDLGIRVIQLAGYDVYYEPSTIESERKFIENLASSVEFAAKYGVVLAFETMETAFMDTVDKSMHYVSMINSPYLQIYPDIGNLMNASLLYRNEVNVDLQTGRGHLVAAHLKETLPGIYRDLNYGQGHVDFVASMLQCWKLGVRNYVAEFWYQGSPEWEKVLSANHQFLIQAFETVNTLFYCNCSENINKGERQ